MLGLNILRGLAPLDIICFVSIIVIVNVKGSNSTFVSPRWWPKNHENVKIRETRIILPTSISLFIIYYHMRES